MRCQRAVRGGRGGSYFPWRGTIACPLLGNVFGPNFRRAYVFALDLLVNLFAVHGDVFGRFYAQADLFPTDFQHHDFDIVTYDNALMDLSRENQHLVAPSVAWGVLKRR